MPSNKSRVPRPRAAIEPQRRHGKERVATLLETGAAVIAEKGYEGATMAEIAARAGSPIGSLYRFFPSKEILAEALIQRYASQIDTEFGKIGAQAKAASIDEIADAILDFTVHRRSEMKVIMALLDARSEWSTKRLEFRNAALRHIVKTLKLLAPGLPTPTARDIAVIIFHNMKTMKALKSHQYVASSPGAMEELRGMNRLYLAHRLAPFRRPTK